MTEGMFEVVDPSLANVIAAEQPRKKRGPNFEIRTATHWLTELVNQQHFGYCTVPSHYDNVPDSDFSGEKYDKYPTRFVVEIGPYHVCRWCYLAEADKVAALDNLPPVEREDGCGH